MTFLVKNINELGWDITNNVYLDYSIVDVVDPQQHVDVTDVLTWHKVSKFCRHDYIKMRDFAIATFVPVWNSLSTEDQEILMRHFVYPDSYTQQDIDAVMSQQEQLEAWSDLEVSAKSCREKRWESVRRKVSFFLTAVEGLDLYTTTKDYSLEYKDADTPNLICWATNASISAFGIDFTTNGFAQKPYYTEALRDMVVDILVNGNY
jgi:hypothetical protein